MHHNNSLSERYITNGQSLGFNFQAEEPTGETHIGEYNQTLSHFAQGNNGTSTDITKKW